MQNVAFRGKVYELKSDLKFNFKKNAVNLDGY